MEKNSATRREISCRVTRTLIMYVKDRKGALGNLLEGLELDEAYLMDTNQWVSHEFLQRLYARMVDVLGDPYPVYKMALASTRFQSLGLLDWLARLVASPKLVYKQVPYFNRFLKANGDVYIREAGDTWVVLEDRYHDGFRKTRHDCDYTRGMFASIPTVFDMPLAHVEEIECQVEQEAYGEREWPDHPTHGNRGCLYRIEWDPRKQPPLWKRLFLRYNFYRKAIRDLQRADQAIQEKYNEVKLLASNLEAANRELSASNEKLREAAIKREKIQKKMKHLAFHDHLTGLPNRLLFTDQLSHALLLSERMAKMLALLYLDLDGFKMINDTMGHAVGDKLLAEVSKRLVHTVRKSDFSARLGGDEFIVLIENVQDIETVDLVAEKILNSFNKPFKLDNQEFFLTTSIGVAVYPTDGEDAETLIKNADIAMYKAKEKGRNQCLHCTPVMKTNIRETMELSNQLYGALNRNELELYYQPQVNSASKTIIGLEALLRWNHPDLGMVSPGQFIPIAEHTGLILPIGEWVIRTACEQNKAWQDTDFPPIPVAVNLSVRQFQNSRLVKQVEEILMETGLDPQYLELEITESVVMKETLYIIETLNAFRDRGIAISIDDFGIEYSSLNYLKQLPVDKIKIAMPFVQGISVSEKDEAIIKSILALAQNLGLRVIAEGVETKKQLCFLSERRCDEIQGFYYYKPMPAREVEKLLVKK